MPRWKAIHDQLLGELAAYEYGSRFYTIADICRKFEVSNITAVRVLNELEAAGHVEKIRRRGTVVRRTHQQVAVYLLLASSANQDLLFPYDNFVRTYTGAMEQATRLGGTFELQSEQHLVELFSANRDGLGLLVGDQVSEESLRFIESRRLPYVLVSPSRRRKGRPHARVDRVKAYELATRHLLELGHRRIACILGHISERHMRDRLTGYRRALRAAGVAFDWSLIRETEDDAREPNEEAVERLLAESPPPTAFVAGSDGRGVEIMRACRARGLAVPEDVSVVSFPNAAAAKLAEPAMTAVDPYYQRMGAAAVTLLFDQIHGRGEPARQRAVVQPELIERDSTAPPPVDGLA